jgi:hypothetical protein
VSQLGGLDALPDTRWRGTKAEIALDVYAGIAML